MTDKLENFIERVTKIEYVVTVFIFLSMLLLMFVQVLFRYIIKMPLSWSEEMLRFLFIAATYLGCAIATKERGHIEINLVEVFIQNKYKSRETQLKAARIVNLIRDFAMAFLLFFLLFESSVYVADLHMMNILSETMMIPMWIITLSMVIGVALSLFHNICLIVQTFRNKGDSGFNFEGGNE